MLKVQSHCFRMKIRAFPNNFGSGYWRIIHPQKYLQRMGHECNYNEGKNVLKEELMHYDIAIPQGAVDLKALTWLLEVRNKTGLKIVTDFDDMLEVTKDNPHYKDHKVLDAVEILSAFAKYVDAITTTNEFLAERLRKFNPNIYIVPNYMDLEYWQLPIQKNETGKIRIGYVGSITHMLDVGMAAGALKKILNKYKDKVELVMVGDARWKEYFEGYKNVECMLGVPFENYASRLNGLQIDIGIAPLRDTEFNHCKSPIKWMENTIAGAATIASPTVYDTVIKHGENGLIARNHQEWIKYLSELIENKELREKLWKNAYKEVTTIYSLANHVHDWEQVYENILKK